MILNLVESLRFSIKKSILSLLDQLGNYTTCSSNFDFYSLTDMLIYLSLSNFWHMVELKLLGKKFWRNKSLKSVQVLIGPNTRPSQSFFSVLKQTQALSLRRTTTFTLSISEYLLKKRSSTMDTKERTTLGLTPYY